MGLALGTSYSVKYVFADKSVKLLQLLNCSGDENLKWKGDWSESSDLWEKFPNVKKACQSLNNSNIEKNSSSVAETTFWISWEDCKHFFSDCGVCYIQRNAFETRVVGYFNQEEPRVPSVVLELKNKDTNNNNSKNTNRVTTMLSQIDSRGLRSEHPQAHGAAMLLSLFDNDRDAAGWYRLVANSTQDIEVQTTESFHYTYIRDVSMSFNLRSSKDPLYVVPRIHEKSRKADTFFCVSIFSSEPLDIQFRTLKPECSVFKNAKAVSHEELKKSLNEEKVHVQYQVRNPKTGRIENF